MTGRERFLDAVAGRSVAFAPLAWERLAELVHQPAEDWWRDPSRGQRLLADLSGLAGADAVVVLAAVDAASAVRAAGARGDEALDRFADTPEAGAGYELVKRLTASESFAAIAGLPTVRWLQSHFEAEEPEAAEDALSDLARGYLDAGADALAVIGAGADEVREAARRAKAAGDFYGRPVLAFASSPHGWTAWLESGGAGSVALLSPDGEWPRVASGVVGTPGDVSGTWDPMRLHAIGSARDSHA